MDRARREAAAARAEARRARARGRSAPPTRTATPRRHAPPVIAGAGARKRPLGGPVFSARGKREQVLIPLGKQGRYRVDTSWDKIVVVHNTSRKGARAWSRATGGEVVTNLAATPLSYGTVRVEMELSRPATPAVSLIKRGNVPHLLLTFLR